MTVADGARAPVVVLDLAGARGALAEEWRAASPGSSGEVAAFYQHSTHLQDDLEAWHQTPERQSWTESVVYVARMVDAKTAIDIGCGTGADLLALQYDAELLDVQGVEPNDHLRASLNARGISCAADVADVPIEQADLLVCLDVLEHVPDPEAFISAIGLRAKFGATLVEATATHDLGTPLHLTANQGWHPGHALEAAGWELLDVRDRVRVWQRIRAEAPADRAGLLICAYRHVSVPTVNSLIALIGRTGWRMTTKTGDGLISRARSIVASRWFRETADDVFLMIDDDMVFAPDAAERLVAQCRAGHDVVCAAYPVRNGNHLALRGLEGNLAFGPAEPPIEIGYAATGFLAVHRRVIEALAATMPLCSADQSWAFWPLFAPMIATGPVVNEYLSEDWAFCARAREAGFSIWLDPSIRIGHLGTVQLDVANMAAVAAASKER